MPIKVGINGFGRIGRNSFGTALDDKDIQFVAVNDITDSKTLAHLLKYDSFGQPAHTITHTEDTFRLRGRRLRYQGKDPAQIDWSGCCADIVVEIHGLFTKESRRGRICVDR